MQPNPSSCLIPNYLHYFRMIGRFIAKALISQLDVEIDLTKSFLKHILRKNLYINDLQDIDPETAKNLIWMLTNDVTELVELGLSFSVDRTTFGVYEVIDLIPDGRNIKVTNENKKQYVKAMAQWIMTDEIKE